MTFDALPSSFRDPSGFVFAENHRIYRQVNKSFAENFDQFIASGLYKALVDKGYLIAHEDVTASTVKRGPDCHRVLAPEIVPYISYPYEWSFSQLKDAAMLTLRIQTIALQHGCILKDASAYNVQFVNGKPVFIDTLSFEPYSEGTPWVAYRQFCQHFLAPLSLMARVDVGLGKLLVTYIDGIPLSLASSLLPLTTRLSYSLQTHIHLHAKMQETYADAAGSSASSKNSNTKNQRQLSKTGLQAIVESLAAAIQSQKWTPPQTEWGDYYDNTNYTDGSTDEKRRLVEEYLVSIDSPLCVVHDLGANTGEFSRIAGKHAGLVVSQDIDPVAVERNYRRLSTETHKNILPLLQDLYAPSPAIGWGNEERDSFRQRGQCDAIMALALVHHLAISNNTPLGHIAALFAELAQWLVIEFVPKSDSQVERLLKTRDDVFPHYNRQGFEEAFSKYFTLIKDQAVAGSERRLYLMRSLTSTEASSGAA